jgi:hypothetical protein
MWHYMFARILLTLTVTLQTKLSSSQTLFSKAPYKPLTIKLVLYNAANRNKVSIC